MAAVWYGDNLEAGRAGCHRWVAGKVVPEGRLGKRYPAKALDGKDAPVQGAAKSLRKTRG